MTTNELDLYISMYPGATVSELAHLKQLNEDVDKYLEESDMEKVMHNIMCIDEIIKNMEERE